MKTSTLLGVSLPAFFSYLAYRYYNENLSNFKPPACRRNAHGVYPECSPRFEGECFFSDSYSSARDKFVTLANAAGAELFQFNIYEDLTTDVAVLRGKNPNRSIMHISGIHGPEGYAGSAVQCAALNYFAKFRDAGGGQPNVTIVFVHAANPYGFNNSRRVNENNIDINRNFLTPEEFAKAIARDPNYARYVDMDSKLNPSEPLTEHWLLNDFYLYKNLLTGIWNYGFSALKKAMVSGNYYKPSGVGYGGVEMSVSARTVVEIMQSEELGMRLEGTEETIVIDVHTGLGPEGVDTLMVIQNADYDALESIFPTEYEGASDLMKKKGRAVGGIKDREWKSASMGYEETIGTTDRLCTTFGNPKLSPSKQTCVTQEFGTTYSFLVGGALVQENQAYHHTECNSIKATYRKKLEGVFKLDKPAWKRSVVRRGMNVLMQASRHLTENK